jgi:ribose transport system substrate-binding protein
VAAALMALAAVAIGCGGDDENAGTASGGGSGGAPDVRFVESVRSLSNEYHANWVKGGEFFAESLPGKPEVKVITDEGDEQAQLSKVRAELARGGDKVVLNVDPTTSANAEALIKAAQNAGAYIVTQWNKPDDLHPWNGYDNWVAHISFDGRVGGYDIAKSLFEQMGGKGKIIALQGILDNVPAKQRFQGLQRALEENPGVELLDDQAADWDRDKALSVTQTLLTKYGDEVTGVWAANDSMALGALEALRARGKAGEIPVVGHDATLEGLQAIEQGEMVATVSTDAPWQGGVGLALGYQAATGKIDPAKLPREQREFYGKQFLVTKDNVAEYLKKPDPSEYAQDWSDPWARSQGPID